MGKSAAKDNAEEEEEETAVEVERVLLDKLQLGIDRNPPQWSSLFKSCKDGLDTKLKSAMDRSARIRFRRSAHLLNNLLAEHDSVLHKINIRFAYRLKQIMDEINGSAGTTKQQEQQQQQQKQQQPQPQQQQQQRQKPLIEAQTERVPSRPTPIDSHGFFEVDLRAAQNLMLCRDNSPGFNTAGIYGPEGVGKTTLVQIVFHSEKARSMFLPRIWICLEDNPDDDKRDSAETFLTRRILLQLGFDGESVKNADRSEIRSALLQRRYMIVLDGASEDKEYNKRMMQMLQDTLPKGTGGAVIVTGRAEDVVKEMVRGGAGAVHRLLPLDKPVKCWDIYKAAAEEEEEKMEDLDERQKVKNEVVKRSDGLPWASTLLGILRREILEKKHKR